MDSWRAAHIGRVPGVRPTALDAAHPELVSSRLDALGVGEHPYKIFVFEPVGVDPSEVGAVADDLTEPKIGMALPVLTHGGERRLDAVGIAWRRMRSPRNSTLR